MKLTITTKYEEITIDLMKLTGDTVEELKQMTREQQEVHNAILQIDTLINRLPGYLTKPLITRGLLNIFKDITEEDFSKCITVSNHTKYPTEHSKLPD